MRKKGNKSKRRNEEKKQRQNYAGRNCLVANFPNMYTSLFKLILAVALHCKWLLAAGCFWCHRWWCCIYAYHILAPCWVQCTVYALRTARSTWYTPCIFRQRKKFVYNFVWFLISFYPGKYVRNVMRNEWAEEKETWARYELFYSHFTILKWHGCFTANLLFLYA